MADKSHSGESPATDCHIALAQYGDLLTVENMAEVLDVSDRTVYRLVEKDELPSVKVGRRLYFPKHLIIEALCLQGG